MEVMAHAGSDDTNLPSTRDEDIAACGAPRAAGVGTPVFRGWNVTGNWFLQAMTWSRSVPTVDATDFRLDTPKGLTTLETMDAIFDGCEMQNHEWKDALGAFSAGEIGMMFWSTSAVGAVERSMEGSTLATAELPGLTAKGPQALPAGGNAAMLVLQSEDPAVQDAAWKWLKFITSGEGAAEVARTTGYMPPNQAANEIILADFGRPAA